MLMQDYARMEYVSILKVALNVNAQLDLCMMQRIISALVSNLFDCATHAI